VVYLKRRLILEEDGFLGAFDAIHEGSSDEEVETVRGVSSPGRFGGGIRVGVSSGAGSSPGSSPGGGDDDDDDEAGFEETEESMFRAEGPLAAERARRKASLAEQAASQAEQHREVAGPSP
jgi:hypothetical protein